MFIPGSLISLLTFPGVIVHELAHQLFCRLFKISVFEVCYFRKENSSGYVIHEIPGKSLHQILIGIGPFFVNTILGAIIAMPAVIPIIKFESTSALNYYILIWLGVSIAMHAFPSIGDAQSIWKIVKSRETPFIHKILVTPIVGIIYIGSIGSVAWLDLFYGIAVAAAIPNLIIKLLV